METALQTGLLPERPRFYTAQTESVAPLDRAYQRLMAELHDAAPATNEPDWYQIAAHKRHYMWPWESVPHSAAHGILDDETYDWLALVQAMIRSNGRPVVVPEGNILAAQSLARNATGIAVSATGTASGKPVRSPAITHLASTSGALVPVNVPGGVQFNVSFSWAQNVPAGATATINGFVLTYDSSKQQWLNNGANASLSGVIGTNEYVVTVQDPAAGVIFANIMTVSFTGSPSSFGVGLRHLVGNPQILTEASPVGAAPYSPSNPLTLGIPFVPDPTKAYTRVLFPGKTYSEWISGYPDVVNPDPTADPDLDGAISFLEYFRGSDPDHPDTSDFDRIGYDDTSVLFSYKKSLVTIGVTEQVQWSSDLNTWSTEGLSYGDDEDLGLVVRRTAQLPLPGDRPAFLRYTLNGP
jgi:hypothetical protein